MLDSVKSRRRVGRRTPLSRSVVYELVHVCINRCSSPLCLVLMSSSLLTVRVGCRAAGAMKLPASSSSADSSGGRMREGRLCSDSSDSVAARVSSACPSVMLCSADAVLLRAPEVLPGAAATLSVGRSPAVLCRGELSPLPPVPHPPASSSGAGQALRGRPGSSPVPFSTLSW